MPDPAIYLWVATLAAFGLFGYRISGYIKVLRGARAEPRWDHIGQRLKLVLVNVLGQKGWCWTKGNRSARWHASST